MEPDTRPSLAVWKFASCDGCQLTLLDCEDELLPLTGRVRVAHFLEMSGAEDSREPATLAGIGPYDLSLVEGSVTTAEDVRRIHHIRRISRRLVTIGACATAGGVQALRNFADVEEFRAAVCASPEYIATLDTSTPISAHVPVDFELRGCPIDRGQLLEVITAFLAGRKPNIPGHSVCFECKRRGTTCITVAQGIPCLGPVTHAARFHRAVAGAVRAACRTAHRATGVRTVVLTGGVFTNALLDEMCTAGLAEDGFTVLRHTMVPPGDGGLALGQAVVAARLADR